MMQGDAFLMDGGSMNDPVPTFRHAKGSLPMAKGPIRHRYGRVWVTDCAYITELLDTPINTLLVWTFEGTHGTIVSTTVTAFAARALALNRGECPLHNPWGKIGLHRYAISHPDPRIRR